MIDKAALEKLTESITTRAELDLVICLIYDEYQRKLIQNVLAEGIYREDN